MAHQIKLLNSHRSPWRGVSAYAGGASSLSSTLRSFFNCDPERGVLTWKVNRGSARKGSVAGTLNGKGYWQIQINGKLYLAHRLIWLYAHGDWPAAEIDHINGICSDNRIENLREATRSENQQNRNTPRDNTSGVKGVYWCQKRKKWRAQCVVQKKVHTIGHFDDLDSAEKAVRAFRERHHGIFSNHGHPINKGVFCE